MSILSNRSKAVDSVVAEEAREAGTLMKEGKMVVSLDSGDPPRYFKTPKYIIDAYIEALRNGLTYYSRGDGSDELKDSVSKRYKRMYGISPDRGSVIVTNGVSEALNFLNSAIVNRGETAVLFRPYYLQYPVSLGLNGGRAVIGDYDESDSWSIDIDGMRRRFRRMARKPKYMMLTNPNNPTGTVLGRRVLKDVVDLANEHNVLLISDEIYDEMLFEGVRYTSVCEVAKGMPHIILNGASKNLNATGFRIGFVVIPEDDKVSEAIRGKLYDYAVSRLSVNTPAQHAVAVGMNSTKEHRVELRKFMREIERRVYLSFRLLSENNYLDVVKPHAAFYLFPKLHMNELRFRSERDFVYRLMDETGVWVREGVGFGSKNHFRVVSLAPKDILEDAILKINEFCRKNAKR